MRLFRVDGRPGRDAWQQAGEGRHGLKDAPHALTCVSPGVVRGACTCSQNFTDALVMGAPRLIMAANDVQKGAYTPGACHGLMV